MKNNENVLYRKKWIACGDSLTRGDFRFWKDSEGRERKESPVIWDAEWGMYKTYPWWIARRNDMTLVRDAYCGSTMALSKAYLEGAPGKTIEDRNPFSLERYLSLPKDADYLTLWFGTNDSEYTILGTIDDCDNTTYYGAWNQVLSYFREEMPNTKIGIIITYWGKKEWMDATRAVAKKWEIPYLDFPGDPNLPCIFSKDESLGIDSKLISSIRKHFTLNEENDHPNLEAHKYESVFIEAFLRSL